MGACTFSQSVIVQGNMRDAYQKACEESREYSGHQDGYSGDIQTTRGFKDLSSKAPRYGTKAFSAFEDKVLDDELYGVRKWEYAGGVEIKGSALKYMKERFGYKGKRGVRAFYFFGWGAE